MVYRVFVEKKQGLDNEARSLCADAANLLGVRNLQKVTTMQAMNVSRNVPSMASTRLDVFFISRPPDPECGG